MKNKKLFFRIYLVFVIILTISIIVLSILGKKERVGYLSEFKINIDNTLEINGLYTKQLFTIDDELDESAINHYILTNEYITNYVYDFRIKYYDKVFRNNDIYNVYPILNNLPDYVQSAEMGNNKGTPFGNLISTKIIDSNENYDISYTLSLKIEYIIFLFFMIIFLIVLKYKSNNSFFDKNINIKLSTMMIMGYLYLILPYIIFIIGWTRYVISIPISISIIILIYFMIKDTIKNYTTIFNINLYVFIFITVLIVLVILLCGIGEIFPQGGDAKLGRNAMFRDLVNFSWPLIYSENGFGFVYYFAHWIIPSIIGKLLGFSAAKIALIIWSSIGIFISFFLIILFINNKNNIFIIISLFIFILFDNLPYFSIGYFGYGSFQGNMMQLYNQYIAITILGGLFLHQKNSSNFAFLGLSITLYSPYTTISIFIFMLVKAILDYKNNGVMELKNIFSKYNILFSILIFPIMYFYLSSLDGIQKEITFIKCNVFIFIKVALCKFGLFMLLLFKDNKKNYIFYISCFIFLLVPFIKFSADYNFYRTNLLAYYFTIVLIIKYFSNNYGIKSIKKYIFIVIIILSFKGSLNSYEDKIINFIQNDFKFTKDIGNKTLNLKTDSWVLKTVTCRNLDDSIFFKYIAKDKK